MTITYLSPTLIPQDKAHSWHTHFNNLSPELPNPLSPVPYINYPYPDHPFLYHIKYGFCSPQFFTYFYISFFIEISTPLPPDSAKYYFTSIFQLSYSQSGPCRLPLSNLSSTSSRLFSHQQPHTFKHLAVSESVTVSNPPKNGVGNGVITPPRLELWTNFILLPIQIHNPDLVFPNL